MKRLEFEQKIKRIQNEGFFLEDRGHCVIAGINGIGYVSVYSNSVPKSFLEGGVSEDGDASIPCWNVYQEEDALNDPCGKIFLFKSEEKALDYAYSKIEEYLVNK